MSKREMKKALKKAKAMNKFEWSLKFNNNIRAEELKKDIQYLETIYGWIDESIGKCFEAGIFECLEGYSKKLDEINERIFEAKAELATL